MRVILNSTIVLLGALVASCTSRPVEDTATGASTGTGAGTGTSTGAGTTSPSTTTPPDPTTSTSSPATTTSTGEPSTTSDAVTTDQGCPSFIGCASDMPLPTKACDPWTQDCPVGEKCMPYSGDGDNSWESLKCTPIMPNPGQVGEPCTVEGNGVSGVDSCDIGHMCWNLDMNGDGTCIKFCTGSPDMPTCDPGFWCLIGQDSILILCMPWCDPLQQDCAGDDLCIPNPQNQDAFLCVLDASGDEGQEFDPCEFVNACDPGLFCADPTLATECDPMAPGCCLSFCDITMPTCAGQGAECVPWFEMGTAPPGFEDVGSCALPP